MSLSSGISDQSFHTTKALCKFDHSYLFQDGQGKFFTFQLESQHGSKASRLFFHNFIARMLWKSRIDHTGNCLLFFQPPDDLDGIFLCLLHTDSQCLDSTEDQPAVKRRQSGSCGLDQETEFLTDIFSVCDQKTGKGVIVSSKKLGAAVYHNICSKIQRILEIRG